MTPIHFVWNNAVENRRDLKLENILVNMDGYLKIIDFGLAKKLDTGGMTKTYCVTPKYLAPEMILQTGIKIVNQAVILDPQIVNRLIEVKENVERHVANKFETLKHKLLIVFINIQDQIDKQEQNRKLLLAKKAE